MLTEPTTQFTHYSTYFCILGIRKNFFYSKISELLGGQIPCKFIIFYAIHACPASFMFGLKELCKLKLCKHQLCKAKPNT